jgi:peptidoglycan/xylan/chitin deacetylase (PgdA/CDA1 family)
LARLFFTILLVLILGGLSAAALVTLVPFLRPYVVVPDLPRMFPFLPPRDGGSERGNRVEVPPARGVEAVWRGPTTKRRVAITFDDGPDPVTTPQILAILEREGVVATFFLVGNRAELYPQLVRSIAAGGHEIGNHTFTHPRLDQMEEEQIRAELAQTTRVLERTARKRLRWFRPPYGRFNQMVLDVANQAGLRTAFWSVDSRDWEGHPPDIVSHRVAAGIAPGAIILLHCAAGTTGGFWPTPAALPDIIAFIRAEGYHPVTLTQLLQR